MKYYIPLLAFIGLTFLAQPIHALFNYSITPAKYTILQQNQSQTLTFSVQLTNLNTGNLSTFYDVDHLIPAGFGAVWDSDPVEIVPNNTKTNNFHATVPGNFYGQVPIEVQFKDLFDNSTLKQRIDIEVQRMPEVLPISQNISVGGYNFTFPIITLPEGANCSVNLDQSLLLRILENKEESIVCKNSLAECRQQTASYQSRQYNYDQLVSEKAEFKGKYEAAEMIKNALLILVILMVLGYAGKWVLDKR